MMSGVPGRCRLSEANVGSWSACDDKSVRSIRLLVVILVRSTGLFWHIIDILLNSGRRRGQLTRYFSPPDIIVWLRRQVCLYSVCTRPRSSVVKSL